MTYRRVFCTVTTPRFSRGKKSRCISSHLPKLCEAELPDNNASAGMLVPSQIVEVHAVWHKHHHKK
uniref:Uncharacterized protein n=1 Tax=Solanum tuberosum TaxID=4113 RepID=M1BC90_SOLTU